MFNMAKLVRNVVGFFIIALFYLISASDGAVDEGLASFLRLLLAYI